jgi:hypothetical protein
MRQEPNNEIDLLLRQLSRRNGVPVSEFDEQHLDADELNSYVANALPAATRARYTEHLADCSGCRKLVAQLSAAQGPVAVQQSGSVVAPSGWKSFLASLFSPMVLRYAVPALGLIVIGVVGIFVFNQQRRAPSIAQLDSESRVSENRAMPQASASESYSTNSPAEAHKARGAVDVPQPADRVAESKPQAATEPIKSAPVVANQSADAAGASAGSAPAAPKAVVADEPPPPKQVDKLKKGDADEQAAASPERAGQREQGASKNEARKEETVTVTASTETRRDISVQSARAGTQPSPGGPLKDYNRVAKEPKARAADKEKDADAAAETRSVAGRRFRKSGSIWIDTEYDSSKPTTNVARGSEQYRALVGDEPSIGTIARELAGEILVVWKGRAYRIR